MYKQKVPLLIIAVLLLAILIVLLSFALTKPCSHCGNDGLIKCSMCKKGKIDCETCDANGYLYCDACRGRGKIKCSDCNQLGYTEGGTCPECRGDGRSSTMLDLSDVGSSELLSKVYRNRKKEFYGWWSYTCNTCDGSGIEHFDCTNCDGEGKYTCSECNGKRFGDICSVCEGSKQIICSKCKGTSNLTCGKCHGTGKQFIWN